MAKLSSKERAALPDSAFGHIEPGHADEMVDGKVPDKYRHFPIHDPEHVRNALARIAQGAKFGGQASAKVHAAAKKFGIDASEDQSRALELYDGDIEERTAEVPDLFIFPERRYSAGQVELRSTGEGDDVAHHITGYASQFNKTSRHMGDFHERVAPTAFDESQRNNWPNAVCRYNHKDDFLLGTTAAGTLKLNVDDTGLPYDVIPPSCRSDVLEYVKRGDVRYSSFAFRCKPGEGDTWGLTDYGTPLRTLTNVEVVDVAPVIDPAYYNTSAIARNIEGAIVSLAAHKHADVEEIRSMLVAGDGKKLFVRTDQPSKPKEEAREVESTEETTETAAEETREAETLETEEVRTSETTEETRESGTTEAETTETEERSADNFRAEMLWKLNSKRYAPGTTE